MDDSGVDPCGREASKVCALSGFVDTVLFELFVRDDHLPARVDLFEDGFDLLETLLGDCAIHFQDAVY